MKNFILCSLFAFTSIIVATPAYAAFPVNTGTEEVSAATAAQDNHMQDNNMNVATASAEVKTTPAPAPSAPAGGAGAGLSIAALVLGIVAVATVSWPVAFVAGALAIIFGAINLHGPKPVMALAGMILGIIAVAVALII